MLSLRSLKFSDSGTAAESLMLTGCCIIFLFIAISISAVEAGVLLLVAGWLLKSITQRKPCVPEMSFSLPFLLFFAGIIISFIFSKTIPEGQRAFSKLISHGFVFLAVTASSRIKKKTELIFTLMSVSLLMGSAYGIFQYITGLNPLGSTPPGTYEIRIFGFFEHPNNFAVILIMGFPALLYFFVRSSRLLHKLLIAAGACLVLLCLVLTFSRGAWIGLLAAGTVWLLLYRRILVIPVAALLIVSTLLMPSTMKQYALKRVTDSMNPEAYSTHSRMAMWQSAVRMGMRRPLCGVGIGNYRDVFNRDRYDRGNHNFLPYEDCHNNYLQIFAEAGIFSFIFFMWFIIVLIHKIIVLLKQSTGVMYLIILTTASALCAFLVHGLVDCTLWQVQASIFFWFCCGMIAGTSACDQGGTIESA